MTLGQQDTIVAIATALGQGAVAIVRLSGDRSLEIAQKIFIPISKERNWSSHQMMYGECVDPGDGKTVDEVMVVYFASPRSFTTEDVVEIQLHGSTILAHKIVELCLALGARLAEPGEFTLRAFLYGRLDLSQAESVLGMIQARSLMGAQMALDQLQGRFSKRVDGMRQALLQWLTLVEAEIDFGDEIESLSSSQNREKLMAVQQDLEDLLSGAQAGEHLAHGIPTVIIGAPNAGKSTLLNHLLGDERALVTEIAGTTRDTVEAIATIDGVVLDLSDTAGLREGSLDKVENLGMERTLKALQKAQLVVWVLDGRDKQVPSKVYNLLKEEMNGSSRLVIFKNKLDQPQQLDLLELKEQWPRATFVEGSLLRQQATELEKAIVKEARELAGMAQECFTVTTRQRQALIVAKESLRDAQAVLDREDPIEFLAAEVRRASQALASLLGLNVSEEVLDRVFSQFCLGK